ncbi:MAG: class I SAM-dependent methyltransferase [Treponema sp.]|nr:class I SAM-dependent methyltransferase [Treponema sp.]
MSCKDQCSKTEWFEKEDFWINFAPIMFDDARWAEAPDVAEYVMKIAGLKAGDSVLDAGCGLGRISVELAALGLDVTGVDIIQAELDAARESAEAEGVCLKLINADLRTFKSDTKFDCAVNLYTSFGYCDTVEEDMMILKSIYDSLKAGGIFILECTSRESAVKYFTKGEEFDRAGWHVHTEFGVVGAWEGLRSKWVLTDDKGKKIEHEFVQRLYSASNLCERLLECGFSSAKAYGDFDLSPYDQDLRTMIIVAKK